MRLGIIGRGPWGDTYARTLRGLGIDFWQAGREWWKDKPRADGLIIASSADSHYGIAGLALRHEIPVLIEKPICTSASCARALLDIARQGWAIAFDGHTRLYSPAWWDFKEKALEEGVRSVYAVAGGPTKIPHWWDWGPHLVAMCIDLGFPPEEAVFVTTDAKVPLHFDVNGGMCFGDVPTSPTPLETLVGEFVAAIESGEPDIRGLEIGVKVVEYIETAAAGRNGRLGEEKWQNRAA